MESMMSLHHDLLSIDRSIDITIPDGEGQLRDLISEKKLGLMTDNGTINHCSLSLSPWSLPEYQFQRVKKTAAVISDIFNQVSIDRELLMHHLDDYPSSTGLLVQLKQLLINTPKIKATNYNFSRQDFLLDSEHQWRLVESNSIAAGMGPFNETVVDIQKQLIGNQTASYADNPARRLQTQTLVNAASKLRNSINPLILFVVEKNEDNIHDQMMLADAIIHSGGRVLFKTLAELNTQLTSDTEQLILEDVGLVDLVYFRTGYNLDDYIDNNGEYENLLQLRAWIEQQQVVVSPTINYQISTSKWIQMKLSKLSITDLSSKFKLTQHQATMAAIALGSKYEVPKNIEDIKSKLATGQWILKSQNEGGGNVYDDSSDFNDYAAQDMDYILMRKIKSIQRNKEVNVFENNQIKVLNTLVSELGIFTLGCEHQYGGYLLRSKGHTMLEAGVHKGGGLLDTIALSNVSSYTQSINEIDS